MFRTNKLRQAARQAELTAFVSEVYTTVHQLNNGTLESQGIDPAAVAHLSHANLTSDRKSERFKPNCPMVASAMAHVLTGHLIGAQEEHLATMGERARKYQGLFGSLGQVGLRNMLYKQMDWLIAELYDQPALSANVQAGRIDDYTSIDAKYDVSLPHFFTGEGRAVRRMLNDVVFDR
jgi:hypothetical protein